MVRRAVRLVADEIIPRVVGRYSPVADHAKGCYVWDDKGDRSLDFTSGIGVVTAGHGHPRVVRAIQEQAAKIIYAQQNIVQRAGAARSR